MSDSQTKHPKRTRAGRPPKSPPPHQLDAPKHAPKTDKRPKGKQAANVRPNRKPTITQQEHAALVAAYQSFPGQHQRAAQATGIPVSTCRKIWQHGYVHPSAPWARTPIQELVRERAEAARADLQLHREAAEKGMAQALGRLDALRARADKAHELADHVTQTRALRGTICELTAVVGEAVTRLSDGLPKVLADTLTPERVVEMAERDPEKPFRLLRGLGKTVQELTAMSESVIKLERLLMGETTEHKGHTVQIEGPAEAVAIIERAARAAARAGGGATAIPGRPGPTKVLPPS